MSEKAACKLWTDALAPKEWHDPDYREVYEAFMRVPWIDRIGLALEEWPVSLRVMVLRTFATTYPTVLLWGKDKIQIYNTGYLVYIARQLHPGIMGEPWQKTWHTILPDWQHIVGLYDGMLENGQTLGGPDICHFVSRGVVENEEVFSNCDLVPCYAENGDIEGICMTLIETTEKVVSQRRDNFFLSLLAARNTSTGYQHVFKSLKTAAKASPLDFPCLALYQCADRPGDAQASIYRPVVSMGVELLCMPSEINASDVESYGDVNSEEKTLKHHLLDVLASRKPVCLTDSHIISTFCQRRAFQDLTKTVILTPIYCFGNEEPFGILLQGLNPRRDQQEHDLPHRLSQELSHLVENVAHRDQVSDQLLERTAELAASRRTFEIMAKACPAGIYILNTSTGIFEYVNDAYFEITGIPKEVGAAHWEQYCHPESLESARTAWANVGNEPIVGFETRWIQPWRDNIERWTSSSAVAHEDPAGNKYIFGAFLDASALRYSLKIEIERADTAVETKQQQLEFLDMIAHELRNPLGAIMQSSDFLIEKLTGTGDASPRARDSQIVVTPDEVEDLRTIVLCAQHMSRIINDTLNLSKLEGGMLIATPLPTQPLAVVRSVLAMFDAEAKKSGTKLQLYVEDSFHELGVDWVQTDPSRLAQIIINLVANSIKFVSRMKIRSVTIMLGASREPTETEVRLNRRPSYVHRSSSISEYEMSSPDIEGQQPLYLVCKICDTGPGMSEDQVSSLFQRYFQASPKTHVEYGGSGLGLFISKQLVTLLNGTISVDSIKDQGTTFSFSIKTSICAPPSAPSMSDTSKASDVDVVQVDDDKRDTILIAEDNLINQKILVKQLRSAGYKTVVANNGLEVIEALREDQVSAKCIAICLCDVEMPVLDGIQAVTEVRELERRGELQGHMPFVAVTANARQEQVAEMLSAGMDDTVPKPFRLPHLLEKMAALANRLGLPQLHSSKDIKDASTADTYVVSDSTMAPSVLDGSSKQLTNETKHRRMADLWANHEQTISPPCDLILLNTPQNQNLTRLIWQKTTKSSGCTRICADGATDRLHREVFQCSIEQLPAGDRPDIVIGDLDSIELSTKQFYEECQATEVIQDPDQNSTDLTKAIRYISNDPEHSEHDIVVLGGLGGRLDQTLSTLNSLFFRQRIYIVEQSNVVMLLQAGTHEVDCGDLGPHCGLAPVNGPVRCWSSGLEWCLNGEIMEMGGLISTNNRIVSKDSILKIRCEGPVLFSVELRREE